MFSKVWGGLSASSVEKSGRPKQRLMMDLSDCFDTCAQLSGGSGAGGTLPNVCSSLLLAFTEQGEPEEVYLRNEQR